MNLSALEIEIARVRRAIGAGASPESVASAMLATHSDAFLALVRAAWSRSEELTLD